MKVFRALTILTLLAALSLPAFVSAQNQTFSVRQSPENPNPGETISLSISAYEFSVDLAKITWSLDGKVKEVGIGKKAFSLVAPANGKTSQVEIEVVPQNGSPIRQTLSFAPADIDILWEALDSYTPPFYRGKSLPISQSQIKVVAMPIVKNPNGTHRKSESFVFTWRKDGKNFPGQSGLGKNGFSFANQILDRQNRVDVSATDGSKTVSGSIIVAPFEPEILFYEINRITGLPEYQEAYDDTKEVKQERLSLLAEPYFLSSNFKQDLNIKTVWKLNDQEVKPSSKNNLIINATTTTGLVNVTFVYDDLKKLFRDFNKTTKLNITK